VNDRQLNSNLSGLIAAADFRDEELLHDYRNRRNDLFLEIAPEWFDSDQPTFGGEAQFRSWVIDVLANTGDDRS
jgi:hypothetical protein